MSLRKALFLAEFHESFFFFFFWCYNVEWEELEAKSLKLGWNPAIDVLPSIGEKKYEI